MNDVLVIAPEHMIRAAHTKQCRAAVLTGTAGDDARPVANQLPTVRDQIGRGTPSGNEPAAFNEPLSGDDEVAHHGHVFVFEVVAVEDVAPSEAVESDGNRGVFEGSQIDRVFPAAVVGAGPAQPAR